MQKKNSSEINFHYIKSVSYLLYADNTTNNFIDNLIYFDLKK